MHEMLRDLVTAIYMNGCLIYLLLYVRTGLPDRTIRPNSKAIVLAMLRTEVKQHRVNQ
jgi:hypothetical protein